MVTNPATRDWTVTASLFATLNEMFGNRTICGIGRGDSAVRVINGKPVTLATLRESIDVIRELANGRAGRLQGQPRCASRGAADRGCEVWVAAYGPKALALTGEVADGFILQLADPDITAWTIAAVRKAAADGRARPGERHDLRRRAGLRHRRHRVPSSHHARDQCRWFGGMVGNHVADIVARYGADGGAVPPGADRLHRRPRRATTTTRTARRATRTPTFVPDEIVDRFCLHRPARARQVARLRASCARSASTSSRVYLQHDAKDATLASYGETVIPAVNPRIAASA